MTYDEWKNQRSGGATKTQRSISYDEWKAQRTDSQQTTVFDFKQQNAIDIPQVSAPEGSAALRNYAAQMQQKARFGAGNVDLYSRPQATTPTGSSSIADLLPKPSVSLTESEFNRSPAMQEKYGSYRNYLNNSALNNLKKASYGESNAPRIDTSKSSHSSGTFENVDSMKPLQRIWNTLKKTVTGGTKNYIGSNVNAQVTAYDAGQNARTAYYNDTMAQYQKELDAATQRQNYMKQHINDGQFTQEDVDAEQNYIDYYAMMLGAYNTGLNAQKGTARETYKLADKVTENAAKDIQSAKDTSYGGKFGEMLVDAGASTVQSTLDAAASMALTGYNPLEGISSAKSGKDALRILRTTAANNAEHTMAPFVVRAFGGGAQKARQEMEAKGTANEEHALAKQVAYGVADAAKEYITEKLGGIGAGGAIGAGSGYLDEFWDLVGDSFAEAIVKSPAARSIVSNLTSAFVSEGAEEAIGDYLEYIFSLTNIYGGTDGSLINDWKKGDGLGDSAKNVAKGLANKLVDATEDFIVGGLSGLGGGAIQSASDIANNTAAGKELRGYGLQQDDIQAFIDTGKESLPGTESRDLARILQQKVDAGKNISNYELGRLYNANVEAVDAENNARDELIRNQNRGNFAQPVEQIANTTRGNIVLPTAAERGMLPTYAQSTELNAVVQQARENGVTRSMVNRVMNSPAMMQEIGVTKRGADGREEVRTKLESLANTESRDIINSTNMAQQTAPMQSTNVANTNRFTAVQNAAEEVASNGGEQSVGENGLREGNLDTGGQSGILAGGAAENQGQRSGNLETLGGNQSTGVSTSQGNAEGRVSGAELGIAEATDTKTATVRTREQDIASGGEDAAYVYDDAAKNGIDITTIDGYIELKETYTDSKGNVVHRKAGGVNIGNRIVINANHPWKTLKQLYNHEKYHWIKRSNPEIISNTLEAIKTTYSDEQIDSIVGVYTELYFTDSEGNITAQYEDIVEEILADAYAGVDLSSVTNTGASLTTSEISETVRSEADKATAKSAEDAEAKFAKESDWKPKFDQTEWDIANGLKDFMAGEDIDSTTRYAFASKKGRDVFIIYSTENAEDPTLLYGVSGESARALKDYAKRFVRGGYHGIDEARRDIDGYIKSLKRSGKNSTSDSRQSEDGEAENKNAGVSGQGTGEESVPRGNLGQSDRDNQELITLRNTLANGKASFSREIDTDGRTLSEKQQKYFKDSKVRDADGNLKVMYHGTDADFTVFNPRGRGGKNGTQEGYGIYFTDSTSVSDAYGGKTLQGYVNITHPARSDEKIITRRDLSKLIQATAENQADEFVASGDYKTITVAIKDTWISNYTDTYSGSITSAINDVASQILTSNENDMDVVQEIMAGMAIRNYNDAYDFYDTLKDTLGIDGFITTWENRDGGAPAEIAIAFDSNQFKNVDNENPTENEDIRFSREIDEESLDDAFVSDITSEEFDREISKILDMPIEKSMDALRNLEERVFGVKSDGEDANGKKLSEAQNKFFSRSAVRNRTGKLLPVYHYTNSEFTKFENRGASVGSNRTLGDGYYVSTNSEEFKSFGRNKMVMYANIVNPFEMELTKAQANEVYDKYFKNYHPNDIGNTYRDHVIGKLQSSIRVFDYLKEAAETNGTTTSKILSDLGFDGVHSGIEWVAFSSNQLKQTTNLNPTENEDIRYSREVDNLKERIDRLKNENKEIRRKRDEKIAELKAHYKQKEAAASNRRKASATLAKIQRHANDLGKMLLNPNDKKHILSSMEKPVAEFLNTLNFESSSSYDLTGKLQKEVIGTPTKRTQKALELKKAYMEISKDATIDPDLIGGDGADGLLDEVASFGDAPLDSLTAEQLDVVWQCVKAVEASVRKANKAFSMARFQNVSDIADAMMADNKDKTAKSVRGKVSDVTFGFLNLDNVKPVLFFHRFGETGDALWKSLRNAQDKSIVIFKDAADFTNNLLDTKALHAANFDSEKAPKVRELERDTVKVTLGGKERTMTTAQLMELYVLMKRPQAVDHILKGGIRLDETRRGKIGEKIYRQNEPWHGVTVEEITAAFGKLTAEQIYIAEQMQKYASTTLSDYGNEASEEVYGYKKFREDVYWPIRTNSQENQKSVESATAQASIANIGMTKQTKPNAKNSVMIGSIFDTFASHVTDMAKYAAYLGVSEDMRRLENFNFFVPGVDENGNPILTKATDGSPTTMMALIDNVQGFKGTKYWDNLMQQVAMGVKGTNVSTSPLNSLAGKYKRASVMTNLRVVIQQPTAIFRAMSMIDAKYLIAGMKSPMKGWNTAVKYCPICTWKDWGYFDVETGREMKDVFFNSASTSDQIANAGMWLAGKADSIAWGQLWSAVEAETKATHKDVKAGSDEFYKICADRFNEIIDRTQVVDGVLQRSQVMRDADGLMKMATSFMAEPTTQLNMLMMAAYDAKHGGDVKLGRTLGAVVVANTINALVVSLIDALRDDDKDKEYWRRWLESLAGITGDEEKFGDYVKSATSSNLFDAYNPLGMIPYVKDIFSVLQGFSVDRMDVEGISDVIDAGTKLVKAFDGAGSYTVPGALVNFLTMVGKATGYGVYNLKRDIYDGVFSEIVAATGDYELRYEMLKFFKNIDVSTNRAAFYDLLYAAKQNDSAAYRRIRKDMMDSGVKESSIESAMKKRAE